MTEPRAFQPWDNPESWVIGHWAVCRAEGRQWCGLCGHQIRTMHTAYRRGRCYRHVRCHERNARIDGPGSIVSERKSPVSMMPPSSKPRVRVPDLIYQIRRGRIGSQLEQVVALEQDWTELSQYWERVRARARAAVVTSGEPLWRRYPGHISPWRARTATRSNCRMCGAFTALIARADIQPGRGHCQRCDAGMIGGQSERQEWLSWAVAGGVGTEPEYPQWPVRPIGGAWRRYRGWR